MDKEVTGLVLLCLKQMLANQLLLLQHVKNKSYASEMDFEALLLALDNCTNLCKAVDNMLELLKHTYEPPPKTS